MKLKLFIHILKKILNFSVFGLASIIFSLLIGPMLFFFIRPVDKAVRKARSLVGSAFRLYVRFMLLTKSIVFNLDGSETLEKSEKMIVCANHPTLLDVVFLIAIIPDADCIVKSSHWKNPITKGVVSKLYIPNSLDAVETVDACKQSLDQGNNIILFPEGTRTNPELDTVKFYRSAAQIALRTGHNVLPVYIGTNGSVGLGKGDSFFRCPEDGIVEYNISVKNIIQVSEYSELPVPIAARRLTEDIKTAIFS